MRAKKEIIELDATIVDMIRIQVYVAELGNGHRLVAVCRGRKAAGTQGPVLKAGDRVGVEVCPGDMTRGWIVRTMTMGGLVA